MAIINFKGANLFYSDEGNGKPLVVIHGFCEDSTIWDEFLNLLPGSSRIIRPDLPGFGKSGLPESDITIDTYAEALNEILINEGIDKCILVGHSMGGYAALSFAEKYPEKVEGIVMFHSSAFADDDNKKQDRLRSIDFVTKNGVLLYIDELYPKLFGAEYYSKHKLQILSLQRYAYKFTVGGVVAALSAMRTRPDRTEVLKKAKVLFIIGKKDTAVPYEKSRQQYALPNVSQLLLLDEVAHMGMFEAPQQCANAIEQFILLV